MKLPPGTYFMQGNEACVEGALWAGLSFYAGYPITPSTEIAEGLALRMPEEGGAFLQMEDEIASISACIGASWAGVKAMTATSGPGFSLMQESIGYASMTETPIVIVDVMRCGPSTGMPTMVGQGDVIQAKYGSHGDYPIIALSPSSVQDMFDLTIRAFNLSERYRVPTIVLTDAEIGHMRGRFEVSPKAEVIDRRVRTDRVWHDGFAYDDSLVPKMPIFGKGFRVHVTGLSHDIAGYPTNDVEVNEELVRRLHEKVESHREDICSVASYKPGSKHMIVSYGSPSFAAWEAMIESEDIGLVDLKTLWPFPSELLAKAIGGCTDVVMVELNLGQMFREVQRVACDEGCRKVRLYSKVGGEVPRPSEITSFIRGGG